MKKILKNISLCMLVTASLTACDLETSPTTSLDADAVFKDAENAEAVLRGIWNYTFNSGQTYASIGLGAIMLNDDFAGSDVVRTTSYGYSPSYQMTNGYARGQINNVMWNVAYDGINNSNSILENIDEESASSDMLRVKGQAYATRGYMYMLLASHYAFAIDKDPNAVCVPIYTKASDYDAALTGNPAASVTEVYDRALEDLRTGYELIPTSYNRGSNATDQYMIDHTVVTGLLARASLYARKWQDAYTYATEAMSLKNNYLMTETEYKSGFNDALSTEWMWGYSCTIDDNLPAYLFYFKDTSTPGNYYTCFNTDPYFKALFDDSDYRKDLFNWGVNGYGEWALLNFKFKFADIDNQLADIIMMRVSEMYLIKAEAAAHIAGKEGEAQDLLKTLRDARLREGATPTVKSTNTGDALLQEIWLERRKELWGEGFSLTDIIRNQQTVERKEFTCYAKLDENGDPVFDADGNPVPATDEEESMVLQGHTRRTFPDGSAFEANSKYYLFRITEQEELQNANLYSEHAKLDFYR